MILKRKSPPGGGLLSSDILIGLLLAVLFVSIHLYLVKRYSLFFFYGEDNESWAANIWTFYHDRYPYIFLKMRNRFSLETLVALPFAFLTKDILFSGRIASLLPSFFTVFVLFIFLRRYAGLVPSLLATLSLISFTRFHLMAMNTTPQSLLLLLQFLLLFSGMKGVISAGKGRFLAAGVLNGLAVTVNDQGFFYLPVFLLLIPFLKGGTCPAPPFSIRRVKGYILGLLILTLPYLIFNSFLFKDIKGMKLSRTIWEHYRFLIKGDEVQFMDKEVYTIGRGGEGRRPLSGGFYSRLSYLASYSGGRLTHFLGERDMRGYLVLASFILIVSPFPLLRLFRREEGGLAAFLLLNFTPLLLYFMTYWEKRHLDFFIPLFFILLALSIEEFLLLAKGIARPVFLSLSLAGVLAFTWYGISLSRGVMRDTAIEQNRKFHIMIRAGDWIRENVPEDEGICSPVPYYYVFGQRGEIPKCLQSIEDGRWGELFMEARRGRVLLVVDNLSPIDGSSHLIDLPEVPEAIERNLHLFAPGRDMKVVIYTLFDSSGLRAMDLKFPQGRSLEDGGGEDPL